MNTRDIAAEYRLAHWAEVMQDADKGVSVKVYCESIGIHQNTYFYLQHKLHEAAVEIQPVETLPEEKSIAPKGWTALCIGFSHDEESAGLTVEIGGCHIAICTDTNLELLSKVCQVLKTL